MSCVLGNHSLGWNRSILILVQNHQVLIITNRVGWAKPEVPSSYRVWEISCRTWSSKKWVFHFFTFFTLLKSLFFFLSPGWLLYKLNTKSVWCMQSKIARDLSYLIVLFCKLTMEVCHSTLVYGIQQQLKCDALCTYFILLHRITAMVSTKSLSTDYNKSN